MQSARDPDNAMVALSKYADTQFGSEQASEKRTH